MPRPLVGGGVVVKIVLKIVLGGNIPISVNIFFKYIFILINSTLHSIINPTTFTLKADFLS